MKLFWWKRTTALSLALGLGALSLQGCGGGSSRASGQDGVDTPVPTVATPISTPNPVPIVVTDPNGLENAIRFAPRNSTIIVVAGTYAPVSLEGEDFGPMTIIADEEGTLVQDAIKGDVTIVGNNNSPAIELIGQSDMTFQGFNLRGGRRATVNIVNSPGTELRHNRISGSGSDGVVIEETDDIIVFNNIISGHAGSGVQILGSNFVEIYNNTVYGNGRSGVSIGSSSQPASTITLRNNIFRGNRTAGISASNVSTLIDSNYNIINDGLRELVAGSRDIVGNTVAEDPLFIAPEFGDFHMANGVSTSISPAIDSGDPFTPDFYVAELRTRTTEDSRVRDTGPIDRGYHYPFSIVATRTPIPSPRPTNTRGPTGIVQARTPTPTPTPTPTIP